MKQIPISGEINDLGCTRLHDDAGRWLGSFLQRLENFLALGVWQVLVDQNQIERLRLSHPQRFLSGPDGRGVETRILKQLLQHDQDVFVAVSDENFLALRFHHAVPMRARCFSHHAPFR